MHSPDSSTNEPSSSILERRRHPRQTLRSLCYVHLDEANGGIVVNISEDGLAVQAAMSVVEDSLSKVRLPIGTSRKWVETAARVVWADETRRLLGIEFLDLAEESRQLIRDWLAEETQSEPDAAHVEAASTRRHAKEPQAEAHMSAATPPAAPPATQPTAQVHAEPAEPPTSPRPEAHPTPEATASKDFDIAALLTSKTAAQTPTVAAPATPAKTQSAKAAPKPKVSPVVIGASLQQKTRTRSSYVPIVVVLAIVSLAAGWEAGRGDMFRALGGLFDSSAATISSANAAAPRIIPESSAVLNFEAIDANGQAWLVPFKGPIAAPPAAPVAQPVRTAAPVSAAPAPTPKPGFQTLIVSTPKASATPNAAALKAEAPSITAARGPLEMPLGPAGPPPPINLAPPSAGNPISSKFTPASLTKRVNPIYPTMARNQKVEGQVKLQVSISATGAVTDVKTLSGSPLLAPAAEEAVRKWQYKPEVLDGRPVPSQADVTINFALP